MIVDLLRRLPLHFIATSLRLQIVAGFIILILPFFALMVMFEVVGMPGTAYRGRLETQRTQTLGDMELVSGLLGQRLLRFYEESRTDAEGLAISPGLRRATAAESGEASRAQLAEELAAFLKTNPSFESLAVIRPTDGAVLAAVGAFSASRSAGDIGLRATELARYATPGYVETVRLHHPSDRRPRIRILRQVLSGAGTGAVVGVLVSEVNVARMLDRELWTEVGVTRRAWRCLVATHDDGRFTLFRNREDGGNGGVRIMTPGDFQPIARALSGIEGSYDGADQNGAAVLAFHRCVRLRHDITLALVLETDRALALAPSWENLRRQGFVWMAMLVFGCGLVAYLASRIARPVNELASVALRLEEGDLTARSTVRSRTEIGRLSRMFNSMADKIEAWQKAMSVQVAELAIARDAADKANRAKSVFLANMSHELRTPLNAILGYTQLMMRGRPPGSEDAESLRIISKSGEHLLFLINGVLDLAKIESNKLALEPVEFDTGEFVREIVDMLRQRAEAKGLSLVVEGASGFPRRIRADRAKLRQVLINIVGNAIKFTASGRVTLLLSSLTTGDSANTRLLAFDVVDTGHGIHPDDRERIFTPFAQGGHRPDVEGTGLGLALSREYVTLMGGKIEVLSEYGHGATFKITVVAEVLAEPASGASPGAPDFRRLL